jgi:putative transposase
LSGDMIKLRFEAGHLVGPPDLRILPWQRKTAQDLGRSVSLQDQMRDLAAIRGSDPDGIGKVPLSVLREHATIVDEAMQAFFKRVAKGQTPGFPRYKGFDQVTTLECTFGDGMSFERRILEGGAIVSCRLKSKGGGLRVRMHRPMPAAAKRVSLRYDGRFWWRRSSSRSPMNMCRMRCRGRWAAATSA